MFIERSTETEIAKQDIEIKQSISRSLTGYLRLVDYATIIYLSIIAILLTFFHRGVQNWPLFVIANFAFVGFLLYFIQVAERSSSKIVKFFRDAYPFFIYILMFKQVAIIVNILFPLWLEPHLIDSDILIFGSHAAVWVQQNYQPWLTEVMAFSYWSYYILIPIAGFSLYFRRDKSLFYSYVFSLSLTLYICYFSYLFLGARGPHETLAFFQIDRAPVGFFDSLVKTIQDRASISGAAFPSSHVAAVWVVWIFMFKFKKWLGWTLFPLILTLSFSVVYLQYHYAVDSIAGILLVCATYPLARFLEKKFAKPTSGTYLETSFNNA